jgi:hypothetical protein
MKTFTLLLLSLLLLSTQNTFAMSAKTDKYDQCPKTKEMRYKLYKDAYATLLSLSGKGESGKLNTVEKQEAATRYQFYANCVKHFGDIHSDSNTPLSCSAKFDKSKDVLTIDMRVREEEAYESLRRVDISIRNAQGKEFFRAMNNRMNHPDPVPPNAFGVYPVEKKKIFTDRDIMDAGHEAAIPVKSQYGYLLKGCKTFWNKGILNIHWKIHPIDWECLDGRGNIFAKIVPKRGKDTVWILCGNFACSEHSGKSDKRVDKTFKLTMVTPQFYDRFNRKKIREGTFSTVTLVKLKQVPAKGIIIRRKGDTPNKDNYVEISRKSINLNKHKSISLEPGYYRFEYNDLMGDPPVGFYDRSDIFEVQDGGERSVDIFVQSAL